MYISHFLIENDNHYYLYHTLFPVLHQMEQSNKGILIIKQNDFLYNAVSILLSRNRSINT